MADASNGGSGRIVPIVMPHSNPDEMPHSVTEGGSPQQFEATVDEKDQQPTNKAASGRKSTRNGTAEAECLEIPCLNELGLYALPTEGDGTILPPLSRVFFACTIYLEELV